MKTLFNFLMVTFLMAILLSVSFAGAVSDNDGSTLITGKIYNADFSNVVDGANVEVNCNGNIQNVTSESTGSYTAIYNKESCSAGDSLNIIAEKNGMDGSASGIIHEDAILNNWDLGVVNVSIVPEFGFFMGILTMMSALGVFFVVRKE